MTGSVRSAREGVADVENCLSADETATL